MVHGASGGDAFEVVVRKAGKATAAAVKTRVEDKGEGLYAAPFTASSAGLLEICVTSRGARHTRRLHGLS